MIDESADTVQGKIKTSIEQAIPWALIIVKREP